MQLPISYTKNKTIQGLRYHFFSKKEIKALLIIVNVFAIIAAILFYSNKIRPEPLLLFSCIWMIMMISVWFILPYSIYKQSTTFNESFILFINESGLRLDNERGYVNWAWNTFSKYFESPNFIHLYFDEKSFFLIPKDNIDNEILENLRELLKRKIEFN